MRDKATDFCHFHTFGAPLAYLTDDLSLSSPAAIDRRGHLFREGPGGVLRRLALGSAWAMTPKRIGGLPALTGMLARDLLSRDDALPDPRCALALPRGLAGIVHDLSVPTLLAAYRNGLFPFSHWPPLKWWSPPTRSLLFFHQFHIGQKVRSGLRKARYTVTFDRDFEAVISACAGRRRDRWHLTWITPRIMRAYADAFDAGHVHSFEVWNLAGKLVGGGYGFAAGATFSGESQFSLERNTSKIGLCVLNYHLAHWRYHFNDGKIISPTPYDMGFREIPRADYLARLAQAVRAPGKSGRWQVEADLATIAAWQPAVDINQA